MHHLNSNGILFSYEQFGFRRNLSTNKATYRLTLEILQAFNNKRDVAGIFCDVAKAFDCINLSILMTKLLYYGINGSANKWSGRQ
jgi:hypothetical protein